MSHDKQIGDIEQYAEMAMKGATEATAVVQRLQGVVDRLEKRVEALERYGRQSFVEDRMREIVEDAITNTLPKPTSEIPDSTTEVKTASGTRVRVRAPWFALLLLAVVATVNFVIWKAKELVAAINSLK